MIHRPQRLIATSVFILSLLVTAATTSSNAICFAAQVKT
jgi:hypothetical protein